MSVVSPIWALSQVWRARGIGESNLFKGIAFQTTKVRAGSKQAAEVPRYSCFVNQREANNQDSIKTFPKASLQSSQAGMLPHAKKYSSNV